ncbi:helix-turn-helix domain-containing protein [Streptomyces sp. NPDC002537]
MARPPRYLTGPARDKEAARLAKRYDAGETINSIAVATGRSYGGTWHLLRHAGVKFRPRGIKAQPAPEASGEEG